MATRVSDSVTTGLCLLLALGLAACSSAPPSRYSQKYDSAPPRQLDPASIADAQPRPETIKVYGNKSPYQVNGKRYQVMSEHNARGYRQQGTASWYGTKFHGHLTSNGEIYDMYQMSAAHKSLPIPCYVRVTNLDNGRTAIVRVNDRGPFHGDRIIDLSYAAATKLGYAHKGVARVNIEVIDPLQYQTAQRQKARSANPAATLAAVRQELRPADAASYLQAAAFSQRASAEALRERLLVLLGTPVTISSDAVAAATLHRVRIGPLDAADVARISDLMVQENFGKPHLVYD